MSPAASSSSIRSTRCPPAGVCTAYGGKGDETGLAWIGRWTRGGQTLDAGQALTLVSGGERREIERLAAAADVFARLVGADAAAAFPDPLIFDSDSTATPPGGADAGSIHTAFGDLRGVDWLDRDRLRIVERAGTLSVRWSGGEAGSDSVLTTLHQYRIPFEYNGKTGYVEGFKIDDSALPPEKTFYEDGTEIPISDPKGPIRLAPNGKPRLRYGVKLGDGAGPVPLRPEGVRQDAEAPRVSTSSTLRQTTASWPTTRAPCCSSASTSCQRPVSTRPAAST